jgi:penicillin-insensitive murein endopeptidase
MPGAAQNSRSRGTPAKGSLERGVSLPSSGAGFVTYSKLGQMTGRQFVHSKVRAVLISAFAVLSARRPQRVFVLGETGLRNGGAFWPHRTHQNGLSVDIFFPVLDDKGQPALMPTGPTNKFGYSLEFDREGRGTGTSARGLTVDFQSTAELLVELHKEAVRKRLGIQRIITAPEYVDRILGTTAGRSLDPLKSLFVRRDVWVRHDEHFHVDFTQ